MLPDLGGALPSDIKLGILAGIAVFILTLCAVLWLVLAGGSIDRLKLETVPLPGTGSRATLFDHLLEQAQTLPLKPIAPPDTACDETGIRLVPLNLETDAQELFEASHRAHGVGGFSLVWEFQTEGPFESVAQFASAFVKHSRTADELVLCVVSLSWVAEERIPCTQPSVCTALTLFAPQVHPNGRKIGVVSLAANVPSCLRVDIGKSPRPSPSLLQNASHSQTLHTPPAAHHLTTTATAAPQGGYGSTHATWPTARHRPCCCCCSSTSLGRATAACSGTSTRWTHGAAPSQPRTAGPWRVCCGSTWW